MQPLLMADIQKVKIIKRRMDNAIREGKTFEDVKEIYRQLNILIAEIDAKWAAYELESANVSK